MSEMGGAEAFAAGVPFAEAVKEFQRGYMVAALKANGGYMGRTAAALGMHWQTVSNFLAECGVDYMQVRKELVPPEVAANRARVADNTRRYKRQAKGQNVDAPKRGKRKPRGPRVVSVLKVSPSKSRQQTGRRVLPMPVAIDDLGWAEAV